MSYRSLLIATPRYVGYGFLHYFFSSLGQTFLISLYVPSFNQAFHLNNADFSWLYAVATLASAFTLPTLGSGVDRYRLRYVSLANALVMMAFCLLLSFATNTLMLGVSLFGLRLTGQGMMVLIGSTAVARYFEKDRGRALALAAVGISAGEALLPVSLATLLEVVAWQSSWQFLALATLVVFVPAVLGLVGARHPFQTAALPPGTPDAPAQGMSRRQVLGDLNFYLLLPAFVFVPFFITGLFIHQNLIADAKMWSMEQMATGFVAFGVVRIATYFVAGPLIDRFSARRLFVFHLVPMALGLLVLGGVDQAWGIGLYLSLAGISASVASLTGVAMWAELYGTRHFGAIKSLVTTLTVLASALGPIVLSELLAQGLSVALPVSVGLAVVVTGLGWWGIRRHNLSAA
ncbi:Predicted arabinose efflux permease, MFS family [Catalinimonas alkaloidigena]|uniref:Predicted arabinose efflux permease, MFS family n=1 Tax=Catalinimonas alkaloidigena TaxID=1075417 RepID=A0A1G9DZC3_9BACT|nr:MFS transporter [Catalinimonas alkaloidigena]SDK69209.1 Predicted arabinose efflux permease, MFS family [Catalinimonas alkaloidigena]